MADPKNQSGPPGLDVEQPELQPAQQQSETGIKPSLGLWARTPIWGKIAAFAVPVAAVVAGLIILGVDLRPVRHQAASDQPAGNQSADTGSQEQTASATGSGRHPKDSGVPTSGSKLEWLEAVCKPDGFVNGLAKGTFSGATAGGICTEPRAGGTDIFYTEWGSSDEMERAIKGLAMCFVASIKSDANTTAIKVFSVLPDPDGLAPSLRPLAQFGLGDPFCPNPE